MTAVKPKQSFLRPFRGPRTALSFVVSLAMATSLMPTVACADTAYPDQNTPAVAPYQGATTVDVGNVSVDVGTTGFIPAAGAEATGGDATLNVHGNVSITGDDQYASLAAQSKATRGNTGTLNIEGNVTADVKDVTTGVDEHAEVDGVEAEVLDPGSYAEANIGGDVNVSITGRGHRYVTSFGVFQYTRTNDPGDVAQSQVTVDGNVSARAIGGSSEVTGIDIQNDNAAQSTTVVKDSVSAQGSYSTGISVEMNEAAQEPYNKDTKAVVTVGGDITASGTNGACGVSTDNYEGAITVHIAGDVNATASDAKGGAIGIDVAGPGGSNSFFVEGTIKAKSYGVTKTEVCGALDVTVWKIESDCVAATESFKDLSLKEDEALEKAINYIIKLEQPKEGNVLKLSGTSKKTVTDPAGTSTFDVAHMGEKVYLDVADGWMITGAFSDTGKSVELNQDSDGRWYVVVPNGGGVYLSATVAEGYLVSFVNDDGTSLQSGMVLAGTMPEYRGATPTKASTDEYTYEFAGWNPTLSPVTGKIVYTATYRKIPRNNGHVVCGGGSICSAARAAIPKTGDSSVSPAMLAVPAIGLMLVGIRGRRMRRG